MESDIQIIISELQKIVGPFRIEIHREDPLHIYGDLDEADGIIYDYDNIIRGRWRFSEGQFILSMYEPGEVIDIFGIFPYEPWKDRYFNLADPNNDFETIAKAII